MSCTPREDAETIYPRSPGPYTRATSNDIQPATLDNESTENETLYPTLEIASARSPSPVPTEIEDPESQDIMVQVQRTGIKIRDFAYGPPYASPPISASPSDASPSIGSESCPIIHHTVTAGVVPPNRTTEIFDPYLALTEIDYRWGESTRTHPVSGKTLRRLLDLGWLTQAELSVRGAEIDMAALSSFDTRRAAASEANQAFPWRPVGVTPEPPTSAERAIMVDNRRSYWRQQDRMALSQAAKAERRLREEQLAMEKKKEIEENMQAIEERVKQERKKLGKRRMEEGLVIPKDKESGGPSIGPKRRRLSPEDDNHLPDGSANMPIPPAQQYPAPLQAYRPELYPDAARIIAASSQSRSRAFDKPLSRPPTPPTYEGQTTPIVPNRGVMGVGGRSERPSQKTGGLQRSSLMRTQTFADLG